MNIPIDNSKIVFYLSFIPTPDKYQAGKKIKFYNLQLLSKTLNKNLQFKEYIPKEKDRLFFYPGCDVPRYKVRSWVENIKGSITIKVDSATVRFASKNSIDACITFKRVIKVDKKPFIDWLTINYGTSEDIQEIIQECSKTQNSFVYLELQDNWISITGYSKQHYSRSYAVGYKKTLHELSEGTEFDPWCKVECIEPGKETLLATLISDSKLYSQESLIKLVNGNSAIIDEEMYISLTDMFNSTNSEDHVTAMSIMASSNLQASLHYILLLLEEFGRKVMLNRKEKNHVNFKSMLEYIGEDRWWNMDTEKHMEILMQKRLLTYKMLKEFAEAVKKMWSKNLDNKYFVVKSIEATDEVKNYFKQQATQQN